MAQKTKAFRSMIGGALGDVGFEAGDILDVPLNKVDEWLAAGVIAPLAASPGNSSTITPAEALGLQEASS